MQNTYTCSGKYMTFQVFYAGDVLLTVFLLSSGIVQINSSIKFYLVTMLNTSDCDTYYC